jgi:hypothetical protein
VLVGEPDGAVVVGVAVGVGVCVGVPAVGVGVGVVVGVGVGVGVTSGVAELVGEVVAEGQPRVVGTCVNGRADGVAAGLWVACTPDGSEVESPLAELPVLAAVVDVGHGPGLDALPDGRVRGREPGLLPRAAPDGEAARRPAMLAVLPPPPPEPPVPVITGWTSSLPPFSTVELTWTSAARSGGTATAAAVIDAAAARPATKRIHPTPCGRRFAQSEAAHSPLDAAPVWPATRRVHPTPCGRRFAQSGVPQCPADTASRVPASQVRVPWIKPITHRVARWSRQ